MKKVIFIFLAFGIQSSINSQTKINGFGNIDASANAEGFKNLTSSFDLGQFDLFVTSKMKNVYFLSELVVENDGLDFKPDLERLIVGYSFNDAIQVQGGKVHIPVGLWNNKFHHGLAIQPTISRPFCLSFEDEGSSIIPIHQVGFEVKGKNITRFKLGYDILISNGITINNVLENNKHKMITAKVYSEPADGLEVSFCGIYDKLDSGNVNTYGIEMQASTVVTTFGAGCSFFNIDKKFEFSSELYIANASTSIVSDKVIGGFLYMGYALKKYKLYSLTNLINRNQKSSNHFFHDGNITSTTLGLSYQVEDQAILKFEYTNFLNSTNNTHGLRAQYAVGF